MTKPRTTSAADIALYISQHYQVFLDKRSEFIEMLPTETEVSALVDAVRRLGNGPE